MHSSILKYHIGTKRFRPVNISLLGSGFSIVSSTQVTCIIWYQKAWPCQYKGSWVPLRIGIRTGHKNGAQTRELSLVGFFCQGKLRVEQYPTGLA